jgi:hypothetical protein
MHQFLSQISATSPESLVKGKKSVSKTILREGEKAERRRVGRRDFRIFLNNFCLDDVGGPLSSENSFLFTGFSQELITRAYHIRIISPPLKM